MSEYAGAANGSWSTLRAIGLSALLVLASSPALAGGYEDCIVDAVRSADDVTGVTPLVQTCREAFPVERGDDLSLDTRGCIIKGAIVSETEYVNANDLWENCQRVDRAAPQVPARIVQEKLVEDNPFVLVAHKQNYILVYGYIRKPNEEPYISNLIFPDSDNPLKHSETKLQLSIKAPLTYSDFLLPSDAIYFGFTIKSFWQLYNQSISSPFRETNYAPEVFYEVPYGASFLDGTLITRLGLEHESNGRSGPLSRSWNRTYLMLGYARENWGLAFRPWYRLPEDPKRDDGDPSTPLPSDGDDNPDIEDFYGHYELTGVYKARHLQWSAMTRYNFETSKGAMQLGFSFKLWGRLKGYFEYFNGYGESLIDYNAKIQRVGIGFLLTDVL